LTFTVGVLEHEMKVEPHGSFWPHVERRKSDCDTSM
jgi:hypothetical protein